jgi:5'-nucleotidase
VAVSYWRVRILVTNDDGVHAPGLAALTQALAQWANAQGPESSYSIFVVAPLENHSGASAAVGAFYERESIHFHSVQLAEAPDIQVFGIDAAPALATIVALTGALGPPPDLVVSGINLGVNVGRSIPHSGTVGAALTAGAAGRSALAVSIRFGPEPTPWETAGRAAVSVLPALVEAPAGTVWNLNVPAVPLGELAGVRRAHVGHAGMVQGAVHVDGGSPETVGSQGSLRLEFGSAIPSLGHLDNDDPDDDGALVGSGYATLSALHGVREATETSAEVLVTDAVASMEKELLKDR